MTCVSCDCCSDDEMTSCRRRRLAELSLRQHDHAATQHTRTLITAEKFFPKVSEMKMLDESGRARRRGEDVEVQECS